MNFLQRNPLLMPLLFVLGCVLLLGSLFVASGAYRDATMTTAERICESYKQDLVEIEQAMTVCYNDPFCRLSMADFAEHEQLQVLTPRVCAGLRPIMPVAEPPPFLFQMPNPGTTAQE